MSVTINFWGDGVNCFCHEAVVRALHDAFDVSIDTLDLAHQKYSSVADQPRLEKSAWLEFLRNGPRFTFALSNGVTGVFSRYEVPFQLPETIADIDAAKIRSFLHGLRHREIVLDEEAYQGNAPDRDRALQNGQHSSRRVIRGVIPLMAWRTATLNFDGKPGYSMVDDRFAGSPLIDRRIQLR